MKNYPVKIPKSVHDRLFKKRKAIDISPEARRERFIQQFGTSKCHRSKLWAKKS